MNSINTQAFDPDTAPPLYRQGDRSNPVHRNHCSDDVFWTTYNISEAFPGVLMPLTWSFIADAQDRANKATFYHMGVLDRSRIVASEKPEERTLDIFYGRAAASLNMFRYLGDRFPGTSGDAIEEQIFGKVRSGKNSNNIYSRYPFVALRLPWAIFRMKKHLHAVTDDIERWWRHNVKPGSLDSIEKARLALCDAVARYEAVMQPHTLVAFVGQAVYDQLTQVAEKAGKPGLELTLATGYGDMVETQAVSDLWQVSKGQLELDDFILRHGYHGPSESDIACKVWRINRSPVEKLVESYRSMSEEKDPRRVEHDRAVKRAEAEAELYANLSGKDRLQARLVLKFAAHIIPLRGTGKAGYLRCIDVGRATARTIGEHWLQAGLINDLEDIFLFSVPELVAAKAPDDTLAIASKRRAERDEYLKLDIPSYFNGVPEAFARETPESDDNSSENVVTGIPICPGKVTGRARVITDLEHDEPLDEDEILVCHTTDPSWAGTMMLASALVIDIGGAVSHGAIVARELGIPCVIGTQDGSQRIKSGDLLEVDGKSGEVVILAS